MKTTRLTGAEFCYSIDRTVRDDTVMKVKKSCWLSIIIDGSTDFTGDDMECIYVRTASHGNVQDAFLDLGASSSACSANIHDHIRKVFKDLDLVGDMKRKLVGYCSDGAANMIGKIFIIYHT